ncbi:hypothetical protein C8F04DRAFT_1106308 [Mycena alexandri]|uniref:DUF6534 domain-containing protein n=1 Tax=Mycena alexandri TaxID=1745969 RepID=A0AAD6X1Y8_9AGAR|nr:hypothetical protein C8F04DRAFT_1106308 [Mycena alexandri]
MEPCPPSMESVLFDPNPTFGALQIGVVLSSILFGVTNTQTYIYYSRFPEDSWRIKALVAFVWTFELAHTVCITHMLYTYTILDYGHPERLVTRAAPRSFEAAVFISGVITAVVQGFFALRIYQLSKTLFIPGVSWALSLVRMGGTTLICVVGVRMVNLHSFLVQWGWAALAIWSVSAANDLLIAMTLAFLLYSQRNNVHKRTAALVDKLIEWTIETGMVTSALGIVTLICYVKMRDNFIWVSLFVIGARVFSNSLLASLNSRVALRAMNDEVTLLSMPAPKFGSRSDHTNSQIQITKTTQVDSDITKSMQMA